MNGTCFRASACLLLVAGLSAAQQPTGILAAYAANRDQGIGNYVTHDAILLGQELCIEEAEGEAEGSLYAPEVQTIIQQLSLAAAKGADSPATAANREFLAVLTALSSGKAPSGGQAKEEFEKVQAAAGISHSAILPETIDYSQFRVRGHYARSPELGRYFQTVRYAETILFAVKESTATGIDAPQADLLTQQALQLASWIQADTKALAAYKHYAEQTGLLFGEADDLVLADLLSVRLIKGATSQRGALFELAKKTGRQPQIVGGLVDVGKLEKGVSVNDALTGWRLFPQRRSADGVAFQQLIFSKVGEYQGKQSPRSMDIINGQKVKAFPLALELPALMGSASALRALDASDERNFQGYAAAFSKAQGMLRQSWPGSWLPVMRQLLATKTETPEAERQVVTTSLAYWTRNRHMSLLYEKQSYTPVAKGMPLGGSRDSAYLEPSVGVYKALLAQTEALAPALKPQTVTAIRAILQECVAISIKESSGGVPDKNEVAFLNDIDTKFLQIAGCEDAPVVVDVHSNPSSQQVLEEATGLALVVEFKSPKTQGALRGARLTHTEFRQPMNERMTDEEWQSRAASSAHSEKEIL